MRFLPNLLIAYGIFLIVVGIVGFASNPEKAKTALMSGGTFGALNILWGILSSRGMGWIRHAALASTAFLTLIFAWRATASWMAVASGESKHLAASLISAMLVASIAMLAALIRVSPKDGDRNVDRTPATRPR